MLLRWRHSFMQMIKFPIQFDSTGFIKLEENTSDYYAQLLTIACLTEPQTFIFSPRFGVRDPAFDGIDKSLFVLNAARFVPEVQIINLKTELDEPSGVTNVEFSFNIIEQE